MTDNLELDELSESAVLDDEPILKKDVGMDDFDIPVLPATWKPFMIFRLRFRPFSAKAR